MLGQFLEFSLAAEPLAPAYEFYLSLGFKPVETGDLLKDPYVALSDGGVAIGLHARPQSGPLLTFVRPQLRAYVRGLRRIGIELDHSALTDHEFNHVLFSDPNGQQIALLEARTFAPADWSERSVRACGEFLEYSVPTHSIERSRAFWEALGFAPVASGESPHPWQRLAGRGLVLGLHEAGFKPGLAFRTGELGPRLEYLRAQRVDARAGAPLADRGRDSATLPSPGGMSIYILEARGD
jgi:catechol 2,3-dioxygenase-like lactoylglutathione lyase family enzyme